MASRFVDPRRVVWSPRAVLRGFSPSAGPSVGLVTALSASAIAVAAAVSPAQAAHGPVLCPFRRATGLPCPGCGLTRSWVDLLHGRVGDAMAANPFGIVALAAAAALVLVVTSTVVRRRAVPSYTDLLGSGLRRRAATVVGSGVLVTWLGFGVARLVVAAVG